MSWDKRAVYAEYGSFDKTLLEMIARDNNVEITGEVELLFDKILGFYGEIHLK